MSSLAAAAAASVETADKPIYQKGIKLIFLPFHSICFFRKHPFRLYEGERLEDMVESIRKNGILMPLIVRRILDEPNYDYEMLSGHNRMNAGQAAGLEGAWCLVKENLSDADAWAYVIETNLLQRSFSELLPSEKAAVLAMRYSEMFSQGKRNDIIEELQLLENLDAVNADATCGTGCHKLSREKVGTDYALKGRAVANYIRIDKLTDGLKRRLDNGEFIIKAGVSLSFISPAGQEAIDAVLSRVSVPITETSAGLLRSNDSVTPLDEDMVEKLLSKGASDKTIPRSVKVSKKIYSAYFPDDTPAKEIEQVIGEALRFYFAAKSDKAG